jgi:hypothetical protein
VRTGLRPRARARRLALPYLRCIATRSRPSISYGWLAYQPVRSDSLRAFSLSCPSWDNLLPLVVSRPLGNDVDLALAALMIGLFALVAVALTLLKAANSCFVRIDDGDCD